MSLRLGIVVLAAGFGRRYGEGNKLHQALNGRPVLAWTLAALSRLPATSAIAVLAPDDALAAALALEAGFTPVPNPARATGMGGSIACGMRALSDEVDAVLIALGDMPRVTHSSLEALLAAFSTRDQIVVPCCDGRRGHPVLFGVHHFSALRALDGDTGAREILKQHAALVREVPVNDPGVLLDVDTPQDLAGAASGLPRAPT